MCSRRLLWHFAFWVTVTMSFVYIFSKLNLTFRFGSRPLNCIAGDLNERHIELNDSTLAHPIYALTNRKWVDILSESYIPIDEEGEVFENEYPVAADIVDIVEATRKGGKVYEEKINEYPYVFLHVPYKLCDPSRLQGKHVFLLFLIKSAVRNFERRKMIRSTWGSLHDVGGFPVQRLFIVGKLKGRNRIHRRVRREIESLNDMLEIDFFDHYYNNTRKSIGGIKYVVEHCAHAQHVMIVDDDYYVATDMLISLLKVMKNKNEKYIYMGWLNQHPKPSRENNSKWFVSEVDFEFHKYPNFISAGAIVMSNDFVHDLYIASQYTKHFIFDDVFIAIVAKKLRIYPMRNFLFSIGKAEYSEYDFWKTIASHDYGKPQELRAAWNCHLLIQRYGVQSNSFW